MKNFLLGAICSGLMVILPNVAWAHTDEHLATVEAPHGGQLRTAGPFHLELVAKDGELRLYVTDHMDNEILTKGGSGKVNIFDKDGNKTSIGLFPIFGNFMKGTGDFKVTPETVFSVFVVLEGYQTEGARFTQLAQKSSSDKESDTHQHGGHHGHDQQPAENSKANDKEDGTENDHHHGHDQQATETRNEGAEEGSTDDDDSHHGRDQQAAENNKADEKEDNASDDNHHHHQGHNQQTTENNGANDKAEDDADDNDHGHDQQAGEDDEVDGSEGE